MQILKQIDLKDAIGKTIKSVHVSYDEFVIVYEDDSFSCFTEYDDWGSTSYNDKYLKYETFIENLNVRSDGSTYFTGFQQFLIDAGILDGDKLIEDSKEKIDRYVKACLDKEKREYERLKLKFN